MNAKPKLIVHGYSIAEEQEAMIEQYGADRRLFNESAALRQILDEWAEMKKAQQSTQPVAAVS
jgi:hypothetical protein